MSNQLKLLLTTELAPDGEPLFRSAASLANKIAEVSDHYRSPGTVANLIGYLFRLERGCPAPLRGAMLKAVTARLSEHPDDIKHKWEMRVSEEIDNANQQFEEGLSSQSESDELQFSELLQRARSADDQFIIAPTAAEETPRLSQASQLTILLLDLLGICPPNFDTHPQTKYRFLRPNKEKAIKFWKGLRNLAQKELEKSGAEGNKSELDRRLQFLDDQNYLQVYAVPSYICGCPIVVFDPDDYIDSDGYSFAYHPNNMADVIRWDPNAVRDWKDYVYRRFPFDAEGQKKPKPRDDGAGQLASAEISFFEAVRIGYSTKSQKDK